MGRLVTNKQMAFVDDVVKGSTAVDAYLKHYATTDIKVATNKAYLLLNQNTTVKKYYQQQLSKLEKKYDIGKDKIIKEIKAKIANYDEMWALGKKDNPTPEEVEKYKRLSSVFKQGDYNKLLDMLNKMAGNYEAEKLDITQTITLKFGNDDNNDNDNIQDTPFELVD